MYSHTAWLLDDDVTSGRNVPPCGAVPDSQLQQRQNYLVHPQRSAYRLPGVAVISLLKKAQLPRVGYWGDSTILHEVDGEIKLCVIEIGNIVRAEGGLTLFGCSGQFLNYILGHILVLGYDVVGGGFFGDTRYFV